MKKPLALIAFLVLGSRAFSQTNYSAETLEKIKEVENTITRKYLLNGEKPNTLAERMAKYKVNGLSIAVIYDYKIAWAKGYGWADVEEKKPVTTETLFEPGSISKTLNSLGILKLAQDKKVDLYTDINTYLTSWKFPYDSLSKGKKITLAQLLSHNAGLSVHGFPGHDIKGPIPSVYKVLDGKPPAFTAPVRSLFEPDLKYQYSGGGTTISQVILTDVTKQAYDVWMYENVLKPIGMIHSSYSQPPAKDRRALCASAYLEDGTPVEHKFHVYPEQAAAGLWMTPSDLCNYIIDMQQAYHGKPSKVLSPEMVKLHLTPYNNGPAAMGTFIEDHKGALYFEHSAGNDGFCGEFFGSLEEGYGVVIFMNSDNPRLLPELAGSVAKAYNWKNFYKAPQLRNTVRVDDVILKTYEGVYLVENNCVGIIRKDSACYQYADGIYSKMLFSSPTAFFNEEFATEKEIIKDEDGKVIGYTRKVNGVDYPTARKVLNPDTLHLKVQDFNGIGWAYLENKKFAEANVYLDRGLALYPGDLMLLGNKAHAELFAGNYREAIAIYKAHLTQKINNSILWDDMIKEDFIYLKKQGLDSKVMDQVFSDLKIKKPKEY